MNAAEAKRSLEKLVGEVGGRLAELTPPGHGFALFMFQHGPGGWLAYASKSDRRDITRLMEEWIARELGHTIAAELQAVRAELAALKAERG